MKRIVTLSPALPERERERRGRGRKEREEEAEPPMFNHSDIILQAAEETPLSAPPQGPPIEFDIAKQNYDEQKLYTTMSNQVVDEIRWPWQMGDPTTQMGDPTTHTEEL